MVARAAISASLRADDMVKPILDRRLRAEARRAIHNPIKTQFGWHIIKVEERRKPPSPKTLAQSDPGTHRGGADAAKG